MKKTRLRNKQEEQNWKDYKFLKAFHYTLFMSDALRPREYAQKQDLDESFRFLASDLTKIDPASSYYHSTA